MKKIAAFFVFFICLLALVVSSSEQGMRKLTKARYAATGILNSDKYAFGDLYGISYLPEFRIPKEEKFLEVPKGLPVVKDIDLYIVGDSYLYSYIQMDTANFARSKQVVFRKWSEGDAGAIVLQPTGNKKVLLIESVERNIGTLIDMLRVRAHLEGYKTPLTWNESLNATLADALYDPLLEQNIDFTLFNFQGLSFLKSLKAQANWDLFHRTTPEVVLSRDHQFLYMKETMDSLQKGSSFYPISAEDIQELLGRMTKIEQYAQSRGFDEVIFSFIPNPVAITRTESRPTNQLIVSLSKANHGRLHILDPTQVLAKGGNSYFFKSDSHWNQQGAQAWLNQLNQYLIKL